MKPKVQPKQIPHKHLGGRRLRALKFIKFHFPYKDVTAIKSSSGKMLVSVEGTDTYEFAWRTTMLILCGKYSCEIVMRTERLNVLTPDDIILLVVETVFGVHSKESAQTQKILDKKKGYLSTFLSLYQ